MADVTSGCTFKRVAPVLGAIGVKITTANTVDNGDTLDLTLADYGLTKVEAVLGFTHSTEDSVIITEAPTTAVSGGVLTITVGGATADKKRCFLVFGE